MILVTSGKPKPLKHLPWPDGPPYLITCHCSDDIHVLTCTCPSPSLQVQQFQETASRLHAQYAGEKADDIQTTEREVVEAWKGLLDASDGRRAELVDTAEKFRFFTMVRDLMAWMESIIQQIETQEKPR